MGIEDYSSEKISQASQVELEKMISKFKSEQIPLYNLAIFLGYNYLALKAIRTYASKYIKPIKKVKDQTISPLIQKKKFSFEKILRKGSMIGLTMSGIYIAGFFAVGYFTIPLSLFHKYCQLQEAKESFNMRFDPQIQELFLFSRMREFGLSDKLITEIKDELDREKDRMIKEELLTQQTIDLLTNGKRQEELS